MRYLVAAAIAAISVLSSPVPAAAQAQQSTQVQGAPTTDQVAVPVWPTASVALPEAQPVAASFSLGQVTGISPDLLAGVTAKGFARKVVVDNQVVGQVLVTSVVKGGREERIAAEGLAAQFDAKDTSNLFPEKTVEVKGSKIALMAALQKLATPQKADETKKVAGDDVSENKVGSNAPSNGQAAGYQSPTVAAAPVSEDKAPTTEMRTTTEGCTTRIDLAQGKAVRQSKVQTFTDGAISSDGQCTDSEVSFPLKRSTVACPEDIVDVATMTAWPQYSLYYTDDAAENHDVGTCTKDQDTSYVITEDESQCAISVDFAAAMAIPKSALVYTNRNNKLVQARGCENSTKSLPSAMTQSAANCTLRHDFAAGISYEKAMWTYVRGGVTYQAAPCTDDGRTFAHETVYTDSAGAYVCTPITNLTGKTVTLQSRKRITIDGASQYVNECTPDTATQAIVSTTDGCTDASKWTHDVAAGVSYGQERFYYTKAGGSRSYVTECQSSAQTYFHNETITGYQNHDDQLWAYALKTVTIALGGGGTYTIKSSEVLPGSAQLPYVLNGTVDQASGTPTYEGCFSYGQTTRYEKWGRPDGTDYLKPIGAGTPLAAVDVCTSTNQTRVLSKECYYNGCQKGQGGVINYGNCTNGSIGYGQLSQTRTKKTNAANGYSSTPAWFSINNANACPSSWEFITTPSISFFCTSYTGGTQQELCPVPSVGCGMGEMGQNCPAGSPYP